MGIGSKLILGSPSSRAKQPGAERSAWRAWGGGDAETTVYGHLRRCWKGGCSMRPLGYRQRLPWRNSVLNAGPAETHSGRGQ